MIERLFASILPSIEHFHLLGYWLAFFTALLETAFVVGLLLPGSTLLLMLGALSASGHLDFVDLLWFAVAGAVLGDNFNYWLGQRYGNRWVRDGVWFLTPDHFGKARSFFDRHGAKSVFLARFIPSVKEVAPFVAGTVGMQRHTFMLWNVLGAIGWGLQWVGGGYLFGQSLNLAQAWMSRAGMALVVVLLVWMLLWLLQRFVVRHGGAVLQVAVSLARSIKAGLGRNRYLRRLARRHPDGVRFLAERVDRAHFKGLPLTLLMLAFAFALALFAGVVEDVVTSDPIVALDHAAAQLIAAFRTPAVVSPALWITSLGEPAVVGALLAVACLVLWLANLNYAIAALLLSSLGASAFSALAKMAFRRPRPVEALLLESSWSFPSGHATAAVAFYGFLGYLLIRSSATWKTQVKLFFATGVLVVLIGLSRIVLGVHYLSDVWAGYLIGTLWLIVGISLSEFLAAGGRINWHAPSEPWRRTAARGLAVVAAVGCVTYASARRLPAPAHPTALSVDLDRPVDELLRSATLSRTLTLLGRPEQPLSFAIVEANADALAARLRRAGWLAADKADAQNMLRLARQGLDYVTAPLAPAFWNDQMNDLAFERPLQEAEKKVVATVRIWTTPYRVGQDRLFVGVVREYDGTRWGVLHTISPDVDAAAEGFVESLKRPGQPVDACRRPLLAPMIGSYLMGGHFFTRGQLWLLDPGDRGDLSLLCGQQGPSQ